MDRTSITVQCLGLGLEPEGRGVVVWLAVSWDLGWYTPSSRSKEGTECSSARLASARTSARTAGDMCSGPQNLPWATLLVSTVATTFNAISQTKWGYSPWPRVTKPWSTLCVRGADQGDTQELRSSGHSSHQEGLRSSGMCLRGGGGGGGGGAPFSLTQGLCRPSLPCGPPTQPACTSPRALYAEQRNALSAGDAIPCQGMP